MKIDFAVETAVSRSPRARQLEAIFDVPAGTKSRIEFKGELPIEARDWSVGLIVGPSGCGKSTILRQVFGEQVDLHWGAPSVLDDFDAGLSTQDISHVCQAVGFNTIPAWLRPYAVLSNGERFRVDLARRLIEGHETIVVDEFTSVIDRQVAQIGAHAVQKFVRRTAKRFVAASCHYDIVEWLQPDWVLEPATMAFQWRSLQRRPTLECALVRLEYDAWRVFAPFHYMSATLNRSAKCFGVMVAGTLASFTSVLYRPHPKVRDIYGFSRTVTLPDWQGLGLASALEDRVGGFYKALGFRLHAYPAHPARIRTHDRSKHWILVKKPGAFSPRRGSSSTVGGFGGRPCAVFQYVGPAHADIKEAKKFLQ
jgi:ABC-type lipoprotein export system ATPase subunit/GNAT superfamily N-acetyltransferase